MKRLSMALAITLFAADAADAAAQVAQVAPAGGACDPGWVSRVYKNERTAVVRIDRPDGGGGTGFVYHSRRHVATAFHVVSLGRSLRVTFTDESVAEGDVVAWDSAMDVAIVRLDRDAPAAPLEPATDVEIGSAILAIGNPYGNLVGSEQRLEGLLNFSVSQGIVSAKSDRYVQTDAVLSPGNSGGPMIGCDGRVVGVADFGIGRVGFAVSVKQLEPLLKTADSPNPPVYRGGPEPIGLLALVVDVDASTWIGGVLGLGTRLYDRWSFVLRGGLALGSDPDTTEPLVDRGATRIFGDLVIGYRALVFPYTSVPTYLELAGGVDVRSDRRSQTRLQLYDDARCPDPAIPTCVPRLTSVYSSNKVFRVAPTLGVSFNRGGLYVGYFLVPDTLDLATVTHRVLVGISP